MPSVSGVEIGMPEMEHPLLQSLQAAELPGSTRWEGVFRGRTGSVRAQTANVCANLWFFSGAIEGEGRSVDFPLPGTAPDRTFVLTGTMSASGEASFEMWFEWPRLAHAPFVCQGALAAGGNEMSGDWRLSCFSRGCACGGGGGQFHLQRVAGSSAR